MPTTYEVDPLRPDVLIVEDDRDLREALLEFLQEAGLVTVAAGNGREALTMAAECSPRLIILDMVMPVMDGRAFLDRRRKDEILSRVPVVVMSGERRDALPRDDVQDPVEAHLRTGPDGDHEADSAGRCARARARSPVRHPIEPAADRRMIRRSVYTLAVGRLVSSIAVGTAGRCDALKVGVGMRRSVLLIEDERDIRDPIAEILREEGFAVVEAADGAQALDLLRDSSPPPGAILLDLMLPVMDGVTFRRRQLEVRAWAHIPVIVMTALSPGDPRLAPLGPVCTLRKPFVPEALLALLRAALADSLAEATSP